MILYNSLENKKLILCYILNRIVCVLLNFVEKIIPLKKATEKL